MITDTNHTPAKKAGGLYSRTIGVSMRLTLTLDQSVTLRHSVLLSNLDLRSIPLLLSVPPSRK